MKTYVLALMLIFGATQAVSAQACCKKGDAKATTTAKMDCKMDKVDADKSCCMSGEAMTKSIDEAVNLSVDQKTQLTEMLEGIALKRKDLKKNTTFSEEDIERATKDIDLAEKEMIKSVLDKKQLKKWETTQKSDVKVADAKSMGKKACCSGKSGKEMKKGDCKM